MKYLTASFLLGPTPQDRNQVLNAAVIVVGLKSSSGILSEVVILALLGFNLVVYSKTSEPF
jgi:hypothetical protein